LPYFFGAGGNGTNSLTHWSGRKKIPEGKIRHVLGNALSFSIRREMKLLNGRAGVKEKKLQREK
jgi:hypothetical protein